ncbi:MAG: MOSC domain-containing protein [Pseudomonadota bacterium]
MKGQLGAMMRTHAQAGRLGWIGLRPERRASVVAVNAAEVTPAGLTGDHAPKGKRSVRLIQAEHLPVIAALAGLQSVRPEELRRNLLVADVNLAALRKATIHIGQVRLQIEGPCPPCSRMEEVLGPGGYNAMRGHGGWYASVVTSGRLSIGDTVGVARQDF